MERKAFSPKTIRSTIENLKVLSKLADLNNTVEVELAISRYKCRKAKGKLNQPASNNYKKHLCGDYKHYTDFIKIQWDKPKYKADPKSIQPPSLETCNKIIATAQRDLSLKIAISTETGLRPIEIVGTKGLTPRCFHSGQNTITALSAKGCNPRPPIHISQELMTRIQTFISKHQINQDEPLFKGTPETYRGHYKRLVNNLGKKLNDPSIANIRLYDLRHAYITRILRRIQNVEIVRQMIGHKNLNTTQKYCHLSIENNGEWIVEQTNDRKRAEELLKNDFTYQLTTPDGYMLFKKLK